MNTNALINLANSRFANPSLKGDVARMALLRLEAIEDACPIVRAARAQQRAARKAAERARSAQLDAESAARYAARTPEQKAADDAFLAELLGDL